MPNLLPARRVPVPSPAQGRGCSQDWGAFPGDTPGKLQPGKGRVTATEPGRLRLSPASSSSPARLHRHARQENKKKAFWRGGAVHPAGLKIFALCRARYPGSRIRPQPRSHAGVRPCPGAGGSRCPRGRAPAGPAPAHTPPVAPGAPRRAGPRAPAGCCRGTVRWSRCTHRAPGGTACTHRTAPCPARSPSRCVGTHAFIRVAYVHTYLHADPVCSHTHTHTLTDGTHAARMHTAHASIRRRLVCTHTPVHTHTQARTHIHAPSVGTPKRMWPSHKSIRTQGAELHMHVLLCTDTHQCAHTLIPLHARTGVCTHGLHPPPTRIHRCCTHTHCCACTRAFPCMCTHTFTFRHTRDSPVRALAGLAPQLGPTNAAGRAGSSRARSPRAAPAPAPHVCRAPKPLTSTWCAGSGTRSSPGRPSS